MVLVRELPPEKRAEGAEIFEDYRSVLLPTADRLVRIVTAVLQIVGVQRLAWMLRCAKTWKRRMERREI